MSLFLLYLIALWHCQPYSSLDVFSGGSINKSACDPNYSIIPPHASNSLDKVWCCTKCNCHNFIATINIVCALCVETLMLGSWMWKCDCDELVGSYDQLLMVTWCMESWHGFGTLPCCRQSGLWTQLQLHCIFFYLSYKDIHHSCA